MGEPVSSFSLTSAQPFWMDIPRLYFLLFQSCLSPVPYNMYLQKSRWNSKLFYFRLRCVNVYLLKLVNYLYILYEDAFRQGKQINARTVGILVVQMKAVLRFLFFSLSLSLNYPTLQSRSVISSDFSFAIRKSSALVSQRGEKSKREKKSSRGSGWVEVKEQ